ncbi:MAG: outer membrane lipoprotein-sorting protein [Myxococcota bacterium]|nr:outer membrane lipoprotein-sorting protein [Myxococcota bacterium]
MDIAMSGADDQYMLYEIRDKQAGKDERVLGIEVTVKGAKRFTKFTAPSDVKGTKILVLSQTQMYVYLPSFKKIRRVASHVTRQGVMGTAFSNDDMALASFADKYDGSIESQDEKVWNLSLKAKEGTDAPYPTILVTVDKKLILPTKLQYHNEKGLKIKTETRTEYSCQGKACTAKVHKMTDHTKNEQVTSLTRKKWKVNQGVKDKIFSRRYLQRAR